MPTLFYNLPQTIRKIFSGRNLFWHFAAMVITYIFVVSGLDWASYVFFKKTIIYGWFFPGAGLLGFFLPVLVILGMVVVGELKKNGRTLNNAWALGQSGFLALGISSFYKVFTGRPGPEIIAYAPFADISRVFKFGILRGGVFWGWPSSHTAVAVAIATTLILLYPRNKIVKILALAAAFYIGFGAAISFHWLSDCVAGAIIGVVIGVAVAKSFKKRTAVS